MNALESMLWPAINMMNRQIQAKTPARDLCVELEGRVVAVRVSNTGLNAFFRVHTDRIELTTDEVDDPDVIIAGSLLALARLGSNDNAIREGAVELAGDVETGARFQKLLRYGAPDLEEELSSVIGDVAAHGVGNVARNVSRWGREASATMRQNVSEYLQEESRTVPSRYEANRFSKRVDELRDDVERFEARLRRLEAGRAEGSN